MARPLEPLMQQLCGHRYDAEEAPSGLANRKNSTAACNPQLASTM
jgi:hypothetical protein